MTQTLPLRCSKCETTVVAFEEGNYTMGVRGEPYVSVEYMLLRCPTCASPFLTKRFGYEGTEFPWEDPTVLYPAERLLDSGVPTQIARSYYEASRCFAINAYTASAILCRRTLEGICVHHGAEKKASLADKLKKLKNDKIIENRLGQWAESLRDVGNEAAHDVDAEVLKADAKDLLEFTRALIEYIFTFADVFEKFKDRRNKAKATPEAAKANLT